MWVGFNMQVLLASNLSLYLLNLVLCIILEDLPQLSQLSWAVATLSNITLKTNLCVASLHSQNPTKFIT